MSDEPTTKPAVEPVNSANGAEKPYKEMEFQEFLTAIGNQHIQNWSILAEGLGVGRNTITRWKKNPQARQALETALNDSLEAMVKVGHTDWRMHRERANMMGVALKQTMEHEVSEDVKATLDKLETDYAKLGQKAAGQVVANDAPIQDKG